jgi:DNA primase
MDVLALAQFGLGQAVAPLGTALTEDQLKRIRRHAPQLTVLFDGDTAGHKAAWRVLQLALPLEVPTRIVAMPEGEDPDTLIRAEGEAAFRDRLLAAPGLMDYFIDWVVAHQAKDNVGRTEAVRQLMPLLGRIPGEVEKTLYIQRLAHRLSIPEQAVQKELAALHKGGRNFRKEGADDNDAKRQGYGDARLTPFEQNLLQALLSKEESARDLLEEISESDWKHQGLRQVWPQLRSQLAKDGHVTELIAALPDEGLRRAMMELAMADEVDSEAQECVALCRRALQRRRLQHRQRHLTRLIREAEERSDLKEIESLLVEKNELLKQLDQAGYR